MSVVGCPVTCPALETAAELPLGRLRMLVVQDAEAGESLAVLPVLSRGRFSGCALQIVMFVFLHVCGASGMEARTNGGICEEEWIWRENNSTKKFGMPMAKG